MTPTPAITTPPSEVDGTVAGIFIVATLGLVILLGMVFWANRHPEVRKPKAQRPGKAHRPVWTADPRNAVPDPGKPKAHHYGHQQRHRRNRAKTPDRPFPGWSTGCMTDNDKADIPPGPRLASGHRRAAGNWPGPGSWAPQLPTRARGDGAVVDRSRRLPAAG